MKRPEWTRDPAAASLALFAGLIMAGGLAIFLGWRVAARTLFVGYQLPALVSGALGGLVLILLGAAFTAVQMGRRMAAQERAATEEVLDEAHALVTAFAERHR